VCTSRMNYQSQWRRVFWMEIWIMIALLSNLESLEKCIIWEQVNWKELKRTIYLYHHQTIKNIKKGYHYIIIIIFKNVCICSASLLLSCIFTTFGNQKGTDPFIPLSLFLSHSLLDLLLLFFMFWAYSQKEISMITHCQGYRVYS
jgi:hypothetical protein